MKRDRRIPAFLCVAALAVSAAGCGYRMESTESDTIPYTAVTGMEDTPVVDYAVPHMSANILTDLRGYSASGVKRAALKGQKLPERFRLVDACTGETVYSGFIDRAAYNGDMKLSQGYADFSDFTDEGRYYLVCGMIGQSYRFEIREKYYGELFRENVRILTKACGDGTLSVADALGLLESFEWYGALFEDGDDSGLPDVLESLKTWVGHKESEGIEESETALYAAFLAKFSYNYQNYDRQYATDCLKRASTVFGQAQSIVGKDSECFFALTELYRATGLKTYGDQITDHRSYFKNNSSYLEEPGYLMGIMTYIATRQRVDVEMCETFMEELMDRAEEISGRCGEMTDPVTARNNGSEELLKRAIQVSCVNYVMNIYQYTIVVEEFLHYLMGENLESVSFYDEDSDRSEYLLLLAQLAAGEEELLQEQKGQDG